MDYPQLVKIAEKAKERLMYPTLIFGSEQLLTVEGQVFTGCNIENASLE